MERTANSMVGDSVRLVRPLEGSRSGNTWLADHLEYKRKVVVRFLTEAEVPTDDIEGPLKFVEEADRSAKIDSEHVARAFEHGLTDDGAPFVVSEHLEGETLRQRLAMQRRLSPRETIAIITQVAEAITRAHETQVVHGDLSPDNIFLCQSKGQEPDVKVLHFSVAPNIPVKTTSDYISPEQYLGKRVDHRADIWALGVIAYEMLTGTLPFDAASRRMMCWDFTPPSKLMRTASEWLDEWFDCALARRVEDRFDSAEQASRQLLTKQEPAAPASVPGGRVGLHAVIDVGGPAELDDQPPDSGDLPDVVIDVED